MPVSAGVRVLVPQPAGELGNFLVHCCLLTGRMQLFYHQEAVFALTLDVAFVEGICTSLFAALQIKCFKNFTYQDIVPSYCQSFEGYALDHHRS